LLVVVVWTLLRGGLAMVRKNRRAAVVWLQRGIIVVVSTPQLQQQ